MINNSCHHQCVEVHFIIHTGNFYMEMSVALIFILSINLEAYKQMRCSKISLILRQKIKAFNIVKVQDSKLLLLFLGAVYITNPGKCKSGWYFFMKSKFRNRKYKAKDFSLMRSKCFEQLIFPLHQFSTSIWIIFYYLIE